MIGTSIFNANGEEWEGQRTKVQIFKGEPILKGKIADKNGRADKNIPPGYCTVTIPVE